MRSNKKFQKRFEQRARGSASNSASTSVPILKYGANTNLATFKQKLVAEGMERYGDLARLIELDKYYEPPRVNPAEYNLKNDPHGFNAEDMKDARKARAKLINEMKANRTAFYAFIYNHLSNESIDAIKLTPEYDKINSTKDPLLLWLAVKETHKSATSSNVEAVVRAETRKKYQDAKQGPFESIVGYKERFDFLLDAYNDADNPRMDDEDIAMDFFRGLDDARYGEFKTNYLNDLMMGTQKPPEHVNDIYTKASKYLTPRRGAKSNGGVAFVSQKEQSTKQRRASEMDRKQKANDDQEPRRRGNRPRKPMVCWGCGEPGHKLSDCPDNVEPEEKQCSVTTMNAYASSGERFEWYEVLLDNQADVSVVHPWLLKDVRPASRKCTVAGLSGHAVELPNVGELDHFFTCKTAEDLRVSVLCQADVEDMYPVAYEPGVSYTVYLQNKELVFRRRNKMYVADMRDWAEGNVNVTSTSMEEQKYTRGEVARAREARELIRNSGFDSEQDAINLVSDGNITGVQLTANDIRRSFDIYGKPCEAIRGKHTKKKVRRQHVDIELKASQQKSQRLYTDLFYVRKQPFMITLSEPLGLTLVAALPSERTDDLGLALQEQVSLLRSHGFTPRIAYLDPQPGFQPLRGKITGVEIDISGAGDHMDRVDSKIRRLKEIIRSVNAGLPWKLPNANVEDLVKYANSRMNLRRPSTSHSIVAPRVAFTGRKPNYRKELDVAFGDYVECYNPKVRSNNAEQDRTEPCIALYPTGNANGSWVFFNIKTQKRIRRTNWVKMRTTQLIIDAMNNAAKTCDNSSGRDDMTPLLQKTDAKDGLDREEDKMNLPEGHESNEEDHNSTYLEESAKGERQLESRTSHEDVVDSAENEDEDVPQLVGDDGDDNDDGERNVPVNNSIGEDHGEQVRDDSGIQSSKPVEYRAYHTSVMKGLQEYGPTAYKAIVAELKQLLHEKKAMSPVQKKQLSKKQLKKTIRSLMFLKTKYDGMGRFEKVKARLVANGAQQDRKLYTDTSSPTAAMQSIMMCLAIAAKEKRHIATVDIGGAYLNAEMTREEVIMELEPMLTTILSKVAPEVKPYVDESGKLYVRLDKALYGCIQSARLWYETITGFLRLIGFKHNEVDPCVMNRVVDGHTCTVVVFVDDLLVMSHKEEDTKKLVQELRERFVEVKYSDDKNLSYLGMHIIIAENGEITVSMKSYIENFLQEHGVTGNAASPATGALFKSTTTKLISKNERRKFHKMVAQLLYLAKRVRPDILLAIAYLSTKVKSPTQADMEKLHRVARYLNATREQNLVLCVGKELAVTGYIDSAFACHEDGKGHTGLVVKVGGATVLCKSSKQRMVTKDSTESELVGLSDMMMQVIQCADFIKGQGYDIGAPVVLQDNTSTLSLVMKGGGKYRSKYLRVRREIIRENYKAGNIRLQHLPTKMMLADALTKPLQGTLYRYMSCGIVGDNTHATGVRRAK